MKSYLHAELDNKKNLISYFILIGLLFFYGIYKNGYLVYIAKQASLFIIFKYLLLIVISLLINTIKELVLYKKITLNYSYLEVLLVCVFMPPTFNLFLYIILLLGFIFLAEYLAKRIVINKVALIHLLLVIGFSLPQAYSYQNLAEVKNLYAYQFSDFLGGRGVSGIATSNIILLIISYIYLSYKGVYKKSIPSISYLTYGVFISLFMLLKQDFNYQLLLSSMTIASLIWVASLPQASPLLRKGQILYALVVGFLSALLNLIFPMEGVFIAILIGSFLSNLIDNYSLKC